MKAIVVASDLIDHYRISIIQFNERYAVIAESSETNVIALVSKMNKNLFAARIAYRQMIRTVNNKQERRAK